MKKQRVSEKKAPTITIRFVDNREQFDEIKDLAKKERRSLNAQLLVIINNGLECQRQKAS